MDFVYQIDFKTILARFAPIPGNLHFFTKNNLTDWYDMDYISQFVFVASTEVIDKLQHLPLSKYPIHQTVVFNLNITPNFNIS